MKAVFWLSVLSRFLNTQAQSIITCPEQIGAAPQACVSEECGGEDLANKGHCANQAVDNSQCLCDPAATTAVPLSTSLVTASVSSTSGVITGTYALATLTQYAGLRESITASITVSPTQSGESAATVAAVVFAGGVAWYLAGLVGGEAAALTAPIEGGSGHQNDETCNNDRSICKDCGAALGFCVDPNPGCACEEEEENECPKISCGAAECKADDGKCTLGNLDGCPCTECPEISCGAAECKADGGKCTLGDLDGCPCTECPDAIGDPVDAPSCSACGGEETDKAQCLNGSPCCKGDETARYKGCICYADSTLSVFGYQNPVDPNELGDWWKEIRERENPICQKQDPNLSEVTAPQHINDGDPSVEKAATEWCASMHGQKVKDEVLYNFNIHGLSSFWLSASYRNSAPDGLNCQNEVTISEQDCVKSLMTAVERCEPRQKMTHGAAIGNGCIFYNVTLSGLTDPDHPPWEGDKGKPKCDDKVSNIERTFFAGITPQFCSQVKGEAIKKTLTNKDFQQPSKGKRSPPPSGTQYEGFKFNFEFSGSDEENCETSCDDSFQEILSACTGQSTMRYKGSLDTGCGTYSYSIEDPPPPPPPKEATCKPFGVPEYLEPYINCDKCRNPTAGYSKSAFQAAAHQNCYGGYEWIAVQDNEDSVYNYGWFDTTTTDTSTNLPTFCLGMTHDKGTWQPDTFSDCKAQGNMGADSKIAFAVVPAKIQDGCKPLRDYELPKDGTCTGIIDKVITDCITGNEEDETGGYYLDKSENGCWEWWIWGISN